MRISPVATEGSTRGSDTTVSSTARPGKAAAGEHPGDGEAGGAA